MKLKLITIAAVAALATGSALAADLPSRKSPPVMTPIPVMTWNGFYVGLNAGYASGNADFNAYPGGSWIGDPDAPGVMASATRSMNLSGGTVSGAVGYNYEFAPFVAGLELDGGWMSLRDPITVGPFPGVVRGFYATTMGASSSYLLTARGRLGYEITPSLLGFVAGGLAGSDISASQTIYFNNFRPPVLLPLTTTLGGWNAGQISGMRMGWTVGGGLEWMFAPNWSAKIEYLYADFGKQDVSSAYLSTNGLLYTVDHQFSRNLNIVRAGLNYHFNLGTAPVVAKY